MLIRSFLLFCFIFDNVLALKSCHYCRGINCQRSSYQETEQCVDELDACISLFQGGTIHAQGCLEKLDDHLRTQCESTQNVQCEICLTEKCNNVGSSQLSCLQCLDSEEAPCGTAPEQLEPQVCEIARSERSFCFASIKDKQVQRGCALTLSEQRSCLTDANCQLCDPLQIPHCNDQLLTTLEVTTDPPTDTSTTSSSSTSTSTSSSSSSPPTTLSTTEPSTSQSTNSPTTSTPTTQSTNPTSITETPSSARSSFNKYLIISLVISNLAMLFLCTQ